MKHKKKNDVRGFVKRNPIAIVVVAMIATLLLGTVAFAAQDEQPSGTYQDVQKSAQEASNVEKSEMVYSMLNANGSVRDTYVVNRFVSDAPGSSRDYGAYTAVSNLSTTQLLVCKDEQVSFDMGADPFFYQGTLENVQLPWNVSLAYALDGNAISPEDLAGSTGQLDITVRTSRNSQVNRAFYDSFVLQITFTLDGGLCTDIKADGATLAASGKDQTIAFTALPGHDGSFKLSAQVKDFEMPSVQIAALPYTSVIEMPDTSEMMGGLESLSSAISQLNQGTSELAKGAEELSSGADSLADGTKEFGDGLAVLSSSSTQIVSASSQINGTLAQIAGALENVDFSSLEGMEQYAPMLREMAGELESLKIVIQAVDGGYAQTAATLDYMASIAYSNQLSDAEIAALRAKVADDPQAAASLERLLATYYALQQALNDYYASGGSPATIAAQLEVLLADGGQFDQVVAALYTAAGFLESGSIDQLEQLKAGLKDLSAGYGQFHTGLVAYTQGVQALNENYGSLSSGTSQFADGVSEFASGADQLSSGVAQLYAETSNLPAQMRERMGELMDDYDFPEFDPVSFVDERNKNVTAVQFVLLTDAIEKPEPEAVEPEPEPEPTMWDRFLALF